MPLLSPRFHPVAEFDEGKRSCRRRLLGHNKRRRKKEDPASDTDDPPAPQQPHLAMATSALPYDAHEEVRRRKVAAAQAPTPPRRLGQGLSLAPFSPHAASVRALGQAHGRICPLPSAPMDAASCLSCPCLQCLAP